MPWATIRPKLRSGVWPVKSLHTALAMTRRTKATDVACGSTLVSVCLPVRNGAERLPVVIGSVLAQTHENLELVVSDNASTDGTENVCRELAASDPRIVYRRHAANVGLLNNFISAMQLSRGGFFRWIGHDLVAATFDRPQPRPAW